MLSKIENNWTFKLT